MRLVSVRIYGRCEYNYRGIGREGVNEDVVKGHIVGAHEKVRPAWRIQLGDALHADASGVIGQE